MEIYQFYDYKQCLAEFYQGLKSQGKYSYARMSFDLGLRDRSFIQHILKGERELPEANLPYVYQWMKLDPEASEYFHLLWDFATTKSIARKEELWQKIRHAQPLQTAKALSSQRVEIFDHWYGFPIKDLLCLGIHTPLELRKALKFNISLEEIHQCIQQLIRLGFVQQKDDQFIDLSPEISAPTQTEFALRIRHYQTQCLDIAKSSLLTSSDSREIQTLAFALSPGASMEAQQILRRARDELILLYQNDSEPKSQIFQSILTLFPTAEL